MHSVLFEKIPSTDPRLGRNIEHDERSRQFAYEEDTSAIVSAEHDSATPTQNQGNGGSCTGQSSTKNMTYETFWAAFEAEFSGILSTTDGAANTKVAEGVYSDAEVLDGDGPYPPQDNGSTGLSVAKVLLKRGWIAGYQHSFSFTAFQTALSKQAVIVGTNWYTGMFDPTSSGELLATGKVEGGHEYVCRLQDLEKKRVGIQNSWGDDWGQNGGQAWMSFDMMEQLLGENGDCTIFVPLGQPAPTPVPPQPTPSPAPTPDDPQATFEAQAAHWVSLRHSSQPNTTFEKQVQEYLDWLSQQ